MTPRISIIAALSENRAIGKNQKLLWHIPEDLQHFKKITDGHPIIMGRKTYESIGKPLLNRTNIIVTRYSDYVAPGTMVYNLLEEAIAAAKEIEKDKIAVIASGTKQSQNNGIAASTSSPRNDVEPEIFIIGGADIFEQTLSLANRLYLTIVEGQYEGDAFFPDYSEFTKVISEEKGESGKYKYKFVTLER